MADGGGSQTSMQSSEPPGWLKPYITGDAKKGIPGILPAAEANFTSNQPAYFPTSTVAGFSPEQNLALQGTANRALAGSPLNDASAAYTLDTLGGKYLGDQNPYIGAIRARGMRDASQVAGMFGAGGRTGSGAAQGSIAEGYTNAVAPYEYGTYNTERGLMTDAAHFAPTLAQQDYTDLSALKGVGDERQQQAQNELNSEVARWNFNTNLPSQKLDEYANLVRGTGSGYGTQYSSTPGPSGLQTGLGALASLASTAAKFGSSEAIKENLQPADTQNVLAKLAELPIFTWSYKGDDTRHLGPTAEEFRDRFGVGDGREIHLADVCGVLLAAGAEIAKRFA